MDQTDLHIMHDEAMDKIQMYASGLITLLELRSALASMPIDFEKVSGLYDPATGLRYQR
jgi:hypothetical protein